MQWTEAPINCFFLGKRVIEKASTCHLLVHYFIYENQLRGHGRCHALRGRILSVLPALIAKVLHLASSTPGAECAPSLRTDYEYRKKPRKEAKQTIRIKNKSFFPHKCRLRSKASFRAFVQLLAYVAIGTLSI
ncbi:unnamed protein product [Cylicocyclus nassatus]|uniref:Uncharacterized protein n=1 Tax=Cylicocyclus nassatus TaxID=53992 RepID=A0AA36DKZ0_CYLNA|nr:unnamed protein product [Cylicocyclus nassatus]